MISLVDRVWGLAAATSKRIASRDFPPTPVLIGHSHSKVIFEAANTSGFALRGYNIWEAPQPAMNEARTALHPEIAAVLATGTVFSAVGGAVHNILAMVQHPRPFDFVLPDSPDLPVCEGTELLPFAAVRDAISVSLAEYLDIIELVRAAAGGRVFHIEAPPPLEDRARILDDVPWMFFPDMTREVAPATLRYKCWRLHSNLVEAYCARAGITVIPVPDAALTASGYLDPTYYADAMHVNAGYGALVLSQMRQLL